MLPRISGEFVLGQDPELRFAQNGMAIMTVRAVASNRKKLDDGSWVDEKTSWFTLKAFKQTAENCAETLFKGHKVTVDGTMHIDEWEGENGKRITPTVLVNSIGPSLAFATAKVVKMERTSGDSSRSSASEDPYTSRPADKEPPF